METHPLASWLWLGSHVGKSLDFGNRDVRIVRVRVIFNKSEDLLLQ